MLCSSGIRQTVLTHPMACLQRLHSRGTISAFMSESKILRMDFRFDDILGLDCHATISRPSRHQGIRYSTPVPPPIPQLQSSIPPLSPPSGYYPPQASEGYSTPQGQVVSVVQPTGYRSLPSRPRLISHTFQPDLTDTRTRLSHERESGLRVALWKVFAQRWKGVNIFGCSGDIDKVDAQSANFGSRPENHLLAILSERAEHFDYRIGDLPHLILPLASRCE